MIKNGVDQRCNPEIGRGHKQPSAPILSWTLGTGHRRFECSAADCSCLVRNGVQPLDRPKSDHDSAARMVHFSIWNNDASCSAFTAAVLAGLLYGQTTGGLGSCPLNEVTTGADTAKIIERHMRSPRAAGRATRCSTHSWPSGSVWMSRTGLACLLAFVELFRAPTEWRNR
jgi:hypothetical protein